MRKFRSWKLYLPPYDFLPEVPFLWVVTQYSLDGVHDTYQCLYIEARMHMLFCHQPTFQSCAFNEVDVVQTNNTTQSFTKQEQLLMLFSMHFCTKDL